MGPCLSAATAVFPFGAPQCAGPAVPALTASQDTGPCGTCLVGYPGSAVSAAGSLDLFQPQPVVIPPPYDHNRLCCAVCFSYTASPMVIKRDGRRVAFDETRIHQAILFAAAAVGEFDSEVAARLADDVARTLRARSTGEAISIEKIQDQVELNLIHAGYLKTARAHPFARRVRAKKDCCQCQQHRANMRNRLR